MRRVLLGDLLAGARLLSQVAPAQRPYLAARLLHEADAAHRYMKRFGRPHPHWGTGSVESRASGLQTLGGGAQIGVDLGNGDILDALAHLARALGRRKRPCLAGDTPHVIG